MGSEQSPPSKSSRKRRVPDKVTANSTVQGSTVQGGAGSDMTVPQQDVVLIHGKTEDGKGLEVLRYRENRLEAGAVRPLEEGKPIQGDVVKLKPRPETPMVCDVEVQVPNSRHGRAEVKASSGTSDATSRRKGPAQVASAAYRKNWEAIWKRSKRRDLPN